MSEQKYRIYSDKVVAKVLNHEAVVINLESGLYYGMDGPAATVWEQLAAGVNQADVAQRLGAAYPEQEGQDEAVSGLIAKLVEEKLLAPDDGAASEAQDGAPQAEWPANFAPLDLVAYDDVAEMVALDPPLPELDYGS